MAYNLPSNNLRYIGTQKLWIWMLVLSALLLSVLFSVPAIRRQLSTNGFVAGTGEQHQDPNQITEEEASMGVVGKLSDYNGAEVRKRLPDGTCIITYQGQTLRVIDDRQQENNNGSSQEQAYQTPITTQTYPTPYSTPYNTPSIYITPLIQPPPPPYSSPYNTPYANPYATPYATPYASPYASPYATPYPTPYSTPYITPLPVPVPPAPLPPPPYITPLPGL
jgi:hypothetical protein